MMNVELLFQGAEHDALDEVLLEEGVCEHHRDGGEHDDGVSHLEGTHLLLVVTLELFVGEVHHVFDRRIIKDQQAALLPDAKTADDEDYQTLIALLIESGQQMRARMQADYADTLDYYTVWAHQIKTPIAAMRLKLQSEDTPLSRRLRGELARIEQYVEMAMVFLRLDSDSTDYVFREVELDAVVRSAVRRFSAEFIDRGLRLEYSGTDEKALTDEKWLSFVLEQLLSNALKYTPSGSISIYIEGEKTLCVADTGIGIAPEDLPRIFDKGYTGQAGRQDKTASGLGLYLCRRICDALGHGIGAQSVPGEGTVIKLDLSKSRTIYE